MSKSAAFINFFKFRPTATGNTRKELKLIGLGTLALAASVAAGITIADAVQEHQASTASVAAFDSRFIDLHASRGLSPDGFPLPLTVDSPTQE